MNDKKIAFIICVNNTQYYEECVRYIQELYVPEGYETDILCIQEAESMTQGYNAGMQATDAKYKVYLHQDAFILNCNFLNEALEVFKKNDSIGMLGILGALKLPVDANCYLSWRVGRIIDYDGRNIGDTDFLKQPTRGNSIDVEAIDGVLMMTQYDVPWREDLLDGWDFYDISQSIEMRKCGYQVVIPYQEQPWCYHDNGVPKLEKYDFYRQRMIGEYPECFSGTIDEAIRKENQRKREETKSLRERMIQAMSLHMYEELQKPVEALQVECPLDTEIREIMNLIEIYHLEEMNVEKVHSEWFASQKWEDIYAYYKQVQWIILRLGFGRKDERTEELKQFVETGKISRDAIRKIANISLVDATEVFRYFVPAK